MASRESGLLFSLERGLGIVLWVRQDTGLERVTGRKARGLQTEKIGCKCQTFFFYLSLKRRQGQPTPVLLPGKSHGQRILEGCSPWVPSSHLILCRPLVLLPPIPPSIRVFSNESILLIRWPKYWSFSFSISPSSEYPGLVSFRD